MTAPTIWYGSNESGPWVDLGNETPASTLSEPCIKLSDDHRMDRVLYLELSDDEMPLFLLESS